MRASSGVSLESLADKVILHNTCDGSDAAGGAETHLQASTLLDTADVSSRASYNLLMLSAAALEATSFQAISSSRTSLSVAEC